MEELEESEVKYTTIPYSELALHLGIAGKIGRVTWIGKNWAVIELNGKKYEGLPSELIDMGENHGRKRHDYYKKSIKKTRD